MRHSHLNEMVKGWFVGDFEPAVLRSTECEVAVKYYRIGDSEELHHHRTATEITVIVTGRVKMLNRSWEAGEIIVIDPGEATTFEALTDAVTVAVKLPSCKDDKFFGPAPT